MKLPLRLLMVTVAICAAIWAMAAEAQEPGTEPGTVVGGSVPSLLELSLAAGKGFADFPARPGPQSYRFSFAATVTTTHAPVTLTIIDGDVTAGSRRGHMTSRSSVLAVPLEAAAQESSFQSLDTPVDPLLRKWTKPVTGVRTRVWLRQRLRRGHRAVHGPYRKLVLVTLGIDGP